MKEAVKGLRDLFNPSLEIRERGRSGSYKQLGNGLYPNLKIRMRGSLEIGSFDKPFEIVQGPWTWVRKWEREIIKIMTEQEKYNQIIKKFEWVSLAYLISLIVFLFMVYHWMGGLIIWFSIYFFGIPLIYVLLPFLGLLMFKLGSRVRIVLSFLISLTPLSYLISALQTFPFTVQTTAAGHTAPISVPLTVGILLSAFIFFLISMISFWYCLRAYPLKV